MLNMRRDKVVEIQIVYTSWLIRIESGIVDELSQSQLRSSSALQIKSSTTALSIYRVKCFENIFVIVASDLWVWVLPVTPYMSLFHFLTSRK